PPPRTTRAKPLAGPTGSTCASCEYGPYQSSVHSIAPECMFRTPHWLTASSAGGVSPEAKCVVEPALAAYSHSASVGNRGCLFSRCLSRSQKATASYQLTPVTYGENRPTSWYSMRNFWN